MRLSIFLILAALFIGCNPSSNEDKDMIYQVIDNRHDLSAVKEAAHTRYHVIKTSGILLDSLEILEGYIDDSPHNYLKIRGYKEKIMSTTYLYRVDRDSALFFLWNYDMPENGF